MMKPIARHCIGALLLLLLLFATSAYAACAWVLWEEHYQSPLRQDAEPEHSLEIRRSTESLSVCESFAQAMKDDQARAAERAGVEYYPGPGFLLIVRYKSGRGEKYRWLCLPDTIDPRGPKGK
jgi:hypothetical protein